MITMAEIIPFPKRHQPVRKVKSIDLYYCWDKKLLNPFLNRLYKEEISYVERWYLETQHLLDLEDTEHPILKLLLCKNNDTLDLLEKFTSKDLEYHEKYEGLVSYATSYKKLSRWLVKWKSLQQHRRLL